MASAEMQAGEDAQKRADLSVRAIGEERTRLMMAFRFLDRALWKMPVVTHGCESEMATDGYAIHVASEKVIASYRMRPNAVARELLHAVLHCIFRHPFRTVRKETRLWSLSCDLCVEAVAVQLCGDRFPLPGDDEIRRLANKIEAQGLALVPAQIYRALLKAERQPESNAVLAQLVVDTERAGSLFARDGHELWNLVEPTENEGAGESRETYQNHGSESSDVHGDPNGQPSSLPESIDQVGQNEDVEFEEDAAMVEVPAELPPDPDKDMQPDANMQLAPAPYDESANTEDEWRDIAQQIETEMRDFERKYGENVGRIVSNLSLVNRSNVDYKRFLRCFCTRNEVIRTSDEEFDYIFYTYGFARYGNMPLIEPLEYQEVDNLREFVIAVDTSGSCSDDLVRVFLTRTCEIMESSYMGDGRLAIHVVQCDAEIQSDMVITGQADLRLLAQTFEVRGRGGTDFRPVFEYVDELRGNGELANMRGMVYFSGGVGRYPENPPDYDVAFVFVENEGETRRVPPWAMRVVLGEDDIWQLQGSAQTQFEGA